MTGNYPYPTKKCEVCQHSFRPRGLEFRKVIGLASYVFKELCRRCFPDTLDTRADQSIYDCVCCHEHEVVNKGVNRGEALVAMAALGYDEGLAAELVDEAIDLFVLPPSSAGIVREAIKAGAEKIRRRHEGEST